MDYELSEGHQALKKEFEKFFREEMKSAPPEYQYKGSEALYLNDETWQFHRCMAKKLVEKGWSVRHWPKEYGGQNAAIIEQLIFNEVRSYYRAPGIDPFGVRLFGPTILLAATEEQKQRLLPPIARAEVTYCQGWTEPNAGSDLAAIESTAIRKGNLYIVNGQKMWTTGAHRADHIFLLLRTDPSKKGSTGLSVFHAKLDLPGVEVRPLYYMSGDHLYNEVFFNNVKIPECDRIGPENEGWQLTRETMNFERSGVELYCEARRCLEDIIEYVNTTKRDGKFLCEYPYVRMKLADLYVDIEVGRTLCYKIAWLQETGGLRFSASAASEAKLFGSELVQRVAEYATEIMGMYGQLSDAKWAPMGGSMAYLYQRSLGFNIAMGTSEIQRNLIAWVGLGLPRLK